MFLPLITWFLVVVLLFMVWSHLLLCLCLVRALGLLLGRISCSCIQGKQYLVLMSLTMMGPLLFLLPLKVWSKERIGGIQPVGVTGVLQLILVHTTAKDV